MGVEHSAFYERYPTVHDLSVEAAAGITGRSVTQLLDLDVPGSLRTSGYGYPRRSGKSAATDPDNRTDADIAWLQADSLTRDVGTAACG